MKKTISLILSIILIGGVVLFSPNSVKATNTKITSVNVTITAPVVGEEIIGQTIHTDYGDYIETSPAPSVTLESGANYLIGDSRKCNIYFSISIRIRNI